MPKHNLVSGTLTNTNRDQILQAINQIRTKLPFLLTLTEHERKSLPKMGDNSVAYVEKGRTFAEQNSDKLGADFGLDEYEEDYELFKNLTPVVTAYRQLGEEISDTMLALGSDLMVRTNFAYGMAKVLGKATGNFDEIRQDIGMRFKGQGKKKAPVPTA